MWGDARRAKEPAAASLAAVAAAGAALLPVPHAGLETRLPKLLHISNYTAVCA